MTIKGVKLASVFIFCLMIAMASFCLGARHGKNDILKHADWGFDKDVIRDMRDEHLQSMHRWQKKLAACDLSEDTLSAASYRSLAGDDREIVMLLDWILQEDSLKEKP